MTAQFADLTLEPAHLHGLTTPFDKAAEISARFITSSEPAVVLTSLTTASVPAFSDGCAIDVIENERAAYRIEAPTEANAAAAGRIMTVFEGMPDAEEGSFRGVVTHTWRARSATLIDVAIARILADRAVAAVTHERLTERGARAEAMAGNLKIALATSRQIGAAIGIVMASHKITEQAAFERLRGVSERHNRKLRDVAADVLMTGWLEEL